MSNYKRPIPQDSPSRQKVVEKKDAQGRTISREMKEREVITANKAPGVEIFKDEDHMVHVYLMKKENDPIKKEYIENSMIQSFHLSEFNLMKQNNLLKGWDAIEVVHDPTLQKGKQSGLQATSTPANGDENLKAAAAKELAEMRDKYQQLYGTPAPPDASLADLKELIDSKNNQLAQEKRGQIINAVNAMSEADLKKQYKKELAEMRDKYQQLYGTPAPPDASLADLKELIDSKNNQLAQEKRGQIINAVNAMSEADLKTAYKKAAGSEAVENADLDTMKPVIVDFYLKQNK